MVMYSYLLAKSCSDPGNPCAGQTMVGHTVNVLKSAQVLDEVIWPSISALGGNGIFERSCWLAALTFSAWLHDIGKANNHFQKAVRERHFQQGLRHDTFAVVLIGYILAEWLESFWSRYPPWLKVAVLCAVSGHHLKFPDPFRRRGHSEIIFLGNHHDMNEFLRVGQTLFELPQVPSLPEMKFSLLPFGGFFETLGKLRRTLELDATPEQKLFIAALKTTLMAADLAGSALPARGIQVADWLKDRLCVVLTRDRLSSFAQERLKGRTLREFQEQIQLSTANTMLLEAGCGSGKTVAAYLWAAARIEGKRLFFCYPTTGTASEGFSGYFHDPDFEAILISSRSRIDYELLENMPSRSPSEIELRSLQLEALDTWPIPVAVCTAHTVLGLLQNVRRGIYSWPSLVRSVLVFDEIHSFPERLFQHLLRFLETFRTIPVLLMTATLPHSRKQALIHACSARGPLDTILGPQHREEALRYSLGVTTEDRAWACAREALAKGQKVLWICNTVGRAIERTRCAREEGLPVEPYHSRYRYRDRLVRHRRVIDGFGADCPAMLAVTTQVAEMSLDISADLLITEFAPPAALIQRLGRLNRYADEPAEVKVALLVRPDDALPYAANDEADKHWAAIEEWLEAVADGMPKSQKDLAAAFAVVSEKYRDAGCDEVFCDWLDDPWTSVKNKHAITDAGYTVEVIREEDLGLPCTELGELAMPMPFPRDKSWLQWERKGRYLVAPFGLIQYDPFWGGKYVSGNDHTHWII